MLTLTSCSISNISTSQTVEEKSTERSINTITETTTTTDKYLAGSGTTIVSSKDDGDDFISTTIIPTEITTEKAFSDMEIITFEGHPTLYGKVEDAHNLWDKYSSDETIVLKNAIGHHIKYEKAYLILDCFTGGGAYRETDSEYIEGITINFQNLKNISNVPFDNALDIAKDFLPIGFLNEKYDLFESCKQDIGNEDNPMSQYSVIYKVKDEFLNEARKNDVYYDTWISVVIRTDKDNNATYLSISENRVADSRNEPEKQDWNYDYVTQ